MRETCAPTLSTRTSETQACQLLARLASAERVSGNSVPQSQISGTHCLAATLAQWQGRRVPLTTLDMAVAKVVRLSDHEMEAGAMARTPFGEEISRRADNPETLAETLFYLSDPEKRRELEEFRIEYEAINGPTDLTRRYTSIWPEQQRAWLAKHDIKRYFDGLPPFARAYLRGKMHLAARDGNLDAMPG
jgi:hypothetical protein